MDDPMATTRVTLVVEGYEGGVKRVASYEAVPARGGFWQIMLDLDQADDLSRKLNDAVIDIEGE